MPPRYYETLAELYRTLGAPMEQAAGFTCHALTDLHTQFPYRSPSFHTGYFSFVFIRAGMGRYTLDEHEFPFGPHTVYFTNPGHLKSFSIECLQEAYLITVTPAFLRSHVHPAIFEHFPFLLNAIVPPLYLRQQCYDELAGMYQSIRVVYGGHTPLKYEVIGGLFLALLYRIKEIMMYQQKPTAQTSRMAQTVFQFKTLLEQHHTAVVQGTAPQPLQVHDYADALHLHPSYLNQVVRRVTGVPARKWLADSQLSAAKTLLLRTGLSVAEVSDRLGFSSPSHFTRAFKRQTGHTPIQFRAAPAL
jgi:AraC-like DNA-binding protein